MQSYTFILIWLLSSVFSCDPDVNSEKIRRNTIFFTTVFYDTTGKVVFADTLRIWYEDSIAIQELHKIHYITDTAGITKVYYPVTAYKFINLRTNRWVNFSSLSDTASVLTTGAIPERGFPDAGWNFYSKIAVQIKGETTPLGDSIINGVSYKLVKFIATDEQPDKSFSIGYVRCDRDDRIFSLEKTFSGQNKCTMSRLLGYNVRNNRPFSKLEVEYVADTIPGKVDALLTKWLERTAVFR